MGNFLLISDDPGRAERLACSLAPLGICTVHDLYTGMPRDSAPRLIISDVETLNSGALARLKQRLDRVRGEGVPYLFLVHGNAARGEAQARMLGATATLPAAMAQNHLPEMVSRMSGQPQPLPAVAQKHAAEAKQFLTNTFFSGRAVTPALVETGTDLVSRGHRDRHPRLGSGGAALR